jgi:cell division septation protein DedD
MAETKAETKAETPSAEHPAPATRPATAPPEAPRPAEKSPTETRPAETRQPETKPAGKSPSDPPPGRYLQVAAPNRAAAGGVVESLKNKGITARLAPGPNEDTVRVLVGPLDAADVGKMKVDLQSAGYAAFSKTY